MDARSLTVTFAARRPARPARFWADMLGREAVEDADGVVLPGTDTQVGLAFVTDHTERSGPHRTLHLHLTSDSAADQDRTVAEALRRGATHLDVGQRPEEGHVVLADPDGNAFCVIPPDSAFLAGCGPLGEVACDGTREVGLFWSRALDWPLVWDQDQETAVQSPHGGTKVAWGGPPLDPKEAGNPQYFTLTSTRDRAQADVDRLIALGASRQEVRRDGTVVLADPDGNEFEVRVT